MVLLNKLKAYLSELLTLEKDMILKPVTTIDKVDTIISKEASFILGGMLSIIFGILSIWQISDLSSSLRNERLLRNISTQNPLGDIKGNITEGLSTSINMLKGYISYPKLFLFYLGFFLLFIGIIFASSYLVGRYAFKSNIRAVSLWKIVITATLPYINLALVGVILNFINIDLSLPLGLLGIIIAALNLYRGINNAFDIEENKTLFMMAIIYLGALYISSVLLSKIMNSVLIKIINKG